MGETSLAEAPKHLIENPTERSYTSDSVVGHDVLSDVLRTIRLTGALQFCFMPRGAWQTGTEPAMAKLGSSHHSTIPLHVMVEGSCWIKMEGRTIDFREGDIVAFPFGTGHQLGVGDGNGMLILPTADLPPRPWHELPMLRYEAHAMPGCERPLRLLCGYIECTAINFKPLLHALPTLLHIRTDAIAARSPGDGAWLNATIAQMVAEADRPRTGGLSMLERLTEIVFIEMLRHQILTARLGDVGWLAAVADPALGRCLALIHGDPAREWSIAELAIGSGLSRSTLSERFDQMLATSPMRYVRDWRLYLASVALESSRKSMATIGHEAGYGTEAAFNRAFTRTYGEPPAAWRRARQK